MRKRDRRNNVNPKWKFLHTRPKLYLALAFLFTFLLSINLVSATTDTTGNTDGSGNYAIGGATPYINFNKITASASGDLQTIGVNLASCAGANVRVAIYQDDGTGNGPSNRLAQSASTACSDGWNDLAVTGVSITTSTIYWLAIMGNSASTTFYVQSAQPRCYDLVTYTDGFPDPAVETCDTNVRVNQRMTYQASAPPARLNNITYSNNITTYPASYNGTFSIFNVTIGTNTTDGLSYNSSLLEINHTASLVNYTMNRFANNVSSLNLSLGAGTYQYREIFNNSAGNYNTTGYVVFTINKATPTLTIAGIINNTYPYSETIYTASNDINGLTVLFVRNGTTNANNSAITYPSGLWNFTSYTTGNANYSATSKTAWNLVSKGTPTGTVTAPVVNYPTSLAVSSTINNNVGTDMPYYIYCNGYLVASATGSAPSGSYPFGAGSYNCLLNTTGGANWTSSSSMDTEIGTVNKGNPTTGTISAPTVTYPDQLSVTSTVGNNVGTDINYTLYCGSVLMGSAIGTAPSGSHLFTGGTYNCVLNTSAGTFANWTTSSSIATTTGSVITLDESYSVSYFTPVSENIVTNYTLSVNITNVLYKNNNVTNSWLVWNGTKYPMSYLGNVSNIFSFNKSVTTPTLTNLILKTTNTVGGVGTPLTNGWQNSYVAMPINASASGVLSAVGLNIHTATGNLTVAIYSGNATSPITLLGQSANTVATVGWNDIPISGGINIVSGTQYWIAFIVSGNLYFWTNTGSGECYNSPVSYSPFPATWPSACVEANRLPNMRMIYNAPSVGLSSQTYQFYFIYELGNSTGRYNFTTIDYDQEVYQTTLIACGGISNTTVLRFSIQDELNNTLIPSNFEWYSVINNINSRNATQNGSSNYNICIYPSWSSVVVNELAIKYYNSSWTSRNYYLRDVTITNTTDQNITLYLHDQVTDVQVQVLDSSQLPLENAITSIERLDWGNNRYYTVAMTKSDYDGKAVTHLQIGDIWYRFSVTTDLGQTYIFSPKNLYYDQTATYVLVTLPLGTGTSLNSTRDFAHTCAYDKTTLALRCSLTSTTGLHSTICLNTSVNGIQNSSSCTTDVSTTLFRMFPNSTQSYYYQFGYTDSLTGQAWIIDSGYVFVKAVATTLANASPLLLGFLSMVLVGSLSLLTLYRPSISIFSTIIGLALCGIIGILNISIGGITAIAILGLLILYRIRY